MRHLNPEISNAPIWIFVQDSINALQMTIPAAGYRKVFWAYYYVQTSVLSSVRELSNIDIDADFLGFPQVQKNNRVAVEAAIDLFNLCRDQDYIGVICHNAGIHPEDYHRFLVEDDWSHLNNPRKYLRFLEKNSFYTLSNKLNIAKENGLQDDRFHMFRASSQA